jgi:predicted TIM-barrel fold metal-dependent hydrolase
MSPGRILREIDAAPFADEERVLVLGGNAERLLGL